MRLVIFQNNFSIFKLIFLAFFTLIISQLVQSGEFSHISDEELRQELERRKNDINRTSKRRDEAQKIIFEKKIEIEKDNLQSEKLKRIINKQARLFYQMTMNNSLFRIAASSSYPIAFLKQAMILKKILEKNLNERREIEMRVASNEDQLGQAEIEKELAKKMIKLLVKDISELETQLRIRAGTI